MAKGKRKDTMAIAREKLADAQAKLASAQERRRRVANEGESEVEQARQRAADQLAKATKDVERRASKVARAEGKILALQAEQRAKAAPPEPPPPVPVVKIEEPDTASPTAAADRLEAIEDAGPTSPVLQPEDAAAPPADNGLVIGRNERTLLTALGTDFDEAGATFSQWLAASQLSKRTFLRARKTLVEAGLVTLDGSGIGARYILTGAGRSQTESTS